MASSRTLRRPVPDPVFDACPSPSLRVRSWSQQHLDRTYAKGAHSQVELALVEEGGVEYKLGTRTVLLQPGQIVHLASGVEHQTKIAVGTRATSILVEAERASALSTALGSHHRDEAFRLEKAERIAAMVATLVAESKAGGAGLTMLSEAIVDALLTLVHRHSPSASVATSTDPRVSAALGYVQDNYPEGISVDDMAQVAGISRFHFSRMFREHTGMSPYRFLTETRLKRAAELLSAGRYSVTQAALSVGFADLGRFSRAFREKYGQTPSAWLLSHSDCRRPRAQSA